MTSKTRTPTDVFLFVPNLIGYARLALTLISYAVTNPHVFLATYTLSFVLDAADGLAAKKLNQCSQFGALLDMVTDRISTMGLVMLLAVRMPNLLLLWVVLNILDFMSHWSRMYSSFLFGEMSHKFTPKNQHWLLTMYYHPTKRNFMMLCCIGNELFYILLYYSGFESMKWLSSSLIANFFFWFLIFPFWFMKQILNGMQLHLSWVSIVEQELEMANKNQQKK